MKKISSVPAILIVLFVSFSPNLSAQETVEEIPNFLHTDAIPFALLEGAPIFSAMDTAGAKDSSLVNSWAEVWIDGTISTGPLGDLHTGFAQGGEDFRAPFFEEMVPYLRTLGAKMVRTDPMGLIEAIRIAEDGSFTIDWENSDRTINALKAAGAKPLFNFTRCPDPWADEWGFPANLEAWSAYVERVVRHYNEERGDGILYWELWNEPNHHIAGYTLAKYCAAYEAMARAVRKVTPEARVGGPSAAALDMVWIEGLMEYCAKNDVPLDFISWHNYCLHPWDYPKEMETIREAAAKYPTLKLELVLGEWNVDWREVEINDNEVCGAHALTTLLFLCRAGLEHSMFFEPRDGWDWKGPSRRFWNRWGLITEKLDRKAGFHAYSLRARLSGETVPVSVSRKNIWGLATREAEAFRILVWNYPRAINLPNPPPRPRDHTGVTLHVRGIPYERWTVERFLVDSSHSNPYVNLEREELERVEIHSGSGSEAVFHLPLSPYAVTLYEIREAAPDQVGRIQAPIRVRPGAFEIFGGLNAEVPLHFEGISPDAVHLVMGETGRDGIRSRVDFAEEEGWKLRMEVPVVDSPKYAYLSIHALERESSDGRLIAWELPLGFLLRPAVEAKVKTRVLDLDRAGDTGNLTIDFANASDRSLDMAVETRVPEGWWAPSRMYFSIEAGDKVAMSVPVRASRSVTENPQDAAGVYLVSVRSSLMTDKGKQAIAETVFYAGVAGVVTYRNTIRVDGDLSDWEGIPVIRIRNPRHPNPVTDPKDLDPYAYLAWDEDYLYIAAEIIDDHYRHDSKSGDLWRGDSVTFGMDLLRDATGDGTYGGDDFEWGVALTSEGLESFKWHAAQGHAGGPFGENLLLQIVPSEGKRIYEIGIPWEEFTPFDPRPGAKMGLNISVTDHDPDGIGTADWGNEIVRHKNPAGLVPVVLIGGPDGGR